MPPLAFSQTHGSSFERLGRRVQRLICSPHVQKVQVVDVLPEPSETLGDWSRLIEELEGTPGIRVDRLEAGAIRIGWREYIDAI
ncbi:DUF1654 domain-containing protein [Pseudomonas alkylphenolica]|uniref:DUF1654 domain-containing protein n=1 Tax=Pseudomonas alkylphenolica TaxID=237609 RepID=A0A6I6H8P6_9PSED|nr:DUF1654 domain-containing protein [Pseudomonas alkylphenolica]QGW77774.1 DUF1654 domain-containing protein [Pseudomonas alkylphenolica]